MPEGKALLNRNVSRSLREETAGTKCNYKKRIERQRKAN